MISESMRDALLKQLDSEFNSAHLYLAMSAHCSHAEFGGAASWLRLQYEEEQQHAIRIYDYLIDQGVHVSLGPISEQPKNFGSLLEVFKASLEHEREMTRKLNQLSNHALNDMDHATYNLLQWFVNEQVEEEATLGGIIAKLRLVQDDGYGLLMIDNELGQRSTPGA